MVLFGPDLTTLHELMRRIILPLLRRLRMKDASCTPRPRTVSAAGFSRPGASAPLAYPLPRPSRPAMVPCPRAPSAFSALSGESRDRIAPDREEAMAGAKEEEEFDVLDARGWLTGRTKARSAVHRDGDWHAAVHVWILLQCPCAGQPSAGREAGGPRALLERALHRGAGGGDAGGSGGCEARCESCQSEWKFLLQRRALNKDSWPGMWDISAAGHVAAGGRVLETAQRELWEELGLRFPRAAFQPLFTHRQRFQGEFHGKAFVNNEFNHVFLVSIVGSIPDEALRLQESEVAEVASFPVSGLRERLLQKDNGYMTYLNGLSGESAGVRLARPALTSRHPPPSSPPKCAPTPPCRGLVSLTHGSPAEEMQTA